MKCFEFYIKLEQLTKRKHPLCVDRFLNRFENITNNDLVPIIVVPFYIYFYYTFVKTEAKMEVNIDFNIRKNIDLQFTNIRTQGLQIGIFDSLIDHVLELIYQSPFKRFVEEGKMPELHF